MKDKVHIHDGMSRMQSSDYLGELLRVIGVYLGVVVRHLDPQRHRHSKVLAMFCMRCRFYRPIKIWVAFREHLPASRQNLGWLCLAVHLMSKLELRHWLVLYSETSRSRICGWWWRSSASKRRYAACGDCPSSCCRNALLEVSQGLMRTSRSQFHRVEMIVQSVVLCGMSDIVVGVVVRRLSLAIDLRSTSWSPASSLRALDDAPRSKSREIDFKGTIIILMYFKSCQGGFEKCIQNSTVLIVCLWQSLTIKCW